ncbi:MAG: THUMP domain-containing protein [Bacteroidales bacterium]|nr:THUMP domain-containing protein [Bacteroidales bacterium]
MQTFELIAKTFQGLEEVLAQELIELGANDVQIGRRMVSFTGDKKMMYRANFCLRTAVRILKPIKHFKAKDADDVYTAIRSVDWAQYLDLTTSFAVDTTVYSTEFRNSRFVAYKVKDAIVDYFVEREGKRPNVSVANPGLRLNIHIAEDDCTLSLDSSGESLHLRGYREASVEAPINEVLAAAIIKMSGWKFDCDFYDPFCGSGTLLVEAALMAKNIYPGVFRKKFGFENWPDFDQELLNEIYDDDSEEREFNHKIYGFDLNVHAVAAAQANIRSAHVQDCVEVAQRDIRDFPTPPAPRTGGEDTPVNEEFSTDEVTVPPVRGARGVLVTNPPYGERLRPEYLTVIYKTLGEVLKKRFTGGEAWVICSKEELFDAMRLRPSFKVPLQNGSIDCELRKYVTFSGKLEDFRGEGGIVKTDGEKRVMGEKKRFRDGRERTFSRKYRPTPNPSLRGRGEDTEENGGWRDRASSPFPRREGAGDGSFRRDEDLFEDDELAAQYRNLRSRHRSFEGSRDARDRKERGEERPRGGRDFKGGRKGGDFDRKGGRDFRGGDRDFKGGKKPFKPGRDKKF